MNVIQFFRAEQIFAIVSALLLLPSNLMSSPKADRAPKDESFEGDAQYIPKTGNLSLETPDGTIKTVTVNRSFSTTIARRMGQDEFGPIAEEKTFEADPISLAKDGAYRRSLDIKTRTGKCLAMITLNPNVRDIPEKGTIIDIDGAFLGFRILDGNKQSYELLGLDININGEETWAPITTVGRAVSPDETHIQEARAEAMRQSGLEPHEQASLSISVTIDYDNDSWWWGSADNRLSEDFLLLSNAGKPQLRISNGPTGETILQSFEVYPQTSK